MSKRNNYVRYKSNGCCVSFRSQCNRCVCVCVCLDVCIATVHKSTARHILNMANEPSMYSLFDLRLNTAEH